jgi:predicted naringenin-chalcone synthase
MRKYKLNHKASSQRANVFAMSATRAVRQNSRRADEGGQLAVEAVRFVVKGSVTTLAAEQDWRFLVQRLQQEFSSSCLSPPPGCRWSSPTGS